MTPRNSCPTLPDQALMSVLVTGSLDHSSTTSPMATLPMPFLASRSGPGQAAPLASMISAAVTVPSSATVRAVIWVSILLGGAMGDGGGGRGPQDDQRATATASETACFWLS